MALATALLIYIGWIRNSAFYGYFGLSSSLVSFSPQDYALRSVEAGFGAVLFLALMGAVLIGLDQLLTRILEATPRWEYTIRRILTGAGAVLVFVSLGGTTTGASTEAVSPMGEAVLLGLGAAMLIRFGMGSAGHARLLPTAAIWFAVAMFVLASLWATIIYAQNLGRAEAEAIISRSTEPTRDHRLQSQPARSPRKKHRRLSNT